MQTTSSASENLGDGVVATKITDSNGLTMSGTGGDREKGPKVSPASNSLVKALDSEGTRTPNMERASTASMIENLKQQRNEIVVSHKTRVAKAKPMGRIVYGLEWDIPKFEKAFPLMNNAGSLCSAGKPKVLTSGKIVAGDGIGRKSAWRFILSEAGGQLSWYLKLNNCLKKEKGVNSCIQTAFSMKLVDGKGRDLLVKERCFQDFGEQFQFGWNDIIDLEKIYAEKDLYLENNTLRIRVQLEMYSDRELRDAESIKQEKEDFARIVTADLNRLRTSTGTADVHLECGGKVFPVHKLILSARSPAFAKMFEGTLARPGSAQNHRCAGDNPPEAEQSIATVCLPDLDPQILDVVLDYIYSAHVKNLITVHSLSGVIRAADKFELLDLKAYCFHALMNFVTEDNIGHIAVLAYRHQADKTVRVNINAFCIRHLESLMKRKSFRDALKTEPDAFFPDEETM